jgi:2-polyprenyl-6-methoxyphenol hydroxylase-like FAD-dependent oxidoreductase
MKALIIGAGIGGLVTAMELAKIGVEPVVFESVRHIKPLGVGINVQPHSVRRLDELGLMEALLDLGVATCEQAFFNHFGQHICTEPRGLAAGAKWPQISIHRGQMQLALLEIARERIGAGNIRLGHHLRDFESAAGEGVFAHFIDRASGASLGAERGDLLIGADGIHSRVRETFYPDEGPAVWNGAIIFRASTETPQFLGGRAQFMVGGRQTVIGYPMSKSYFDRGRSLTNWAARFFVDASQGFPREDWNKRGDLEDFLPRYANWRFDWMDFPALFKGAEAVFEFPMVDRDPLPQWTHGRATLLGDSAHPMYPLGSNGASQAILDAHELAMRLDASADIDAALRAYDEERRPKTAEIVRQNRAGGPERIVTMVEQRAPNGFASIDEVMPSAEIRAIMDSYKAITSFDLARASG